MINTRKYASSVYKSSMNGIKQSKKKFVNIMKYIHANNDIEKELTSDIKSNLNQLNRLWKNNEDANIEFYFKMKEYHSKINGKFKNETLIIMWDEYIMSCIQLRCQLLKLNQLCKTLY